jgi:hypothetical protein
MPKRAIQKRKNLFLPKFAEHQSVAGKSTLQAIKKMVTIHKLSSFDIEKLPAIYFRATLAIEVFKTSTNVANITAIVIIKRLAFGFHSCTVASVITLLFTKYRIVITI